MVQGPGDTAYLTLAYRAPAASHKDYLPLVLLNAAFAGGSSLGMFGGGGSNKSSRIYKALVNTELAASASGSLTPTVDPFLYTVNVVVQSGRTLAEVEPMIEFLVVDAPNFDEDSWTKIITKGKLVAEMLDATIDRLTTLASSGAEDWLPAAIQQAVAEAAVVAGLVNAEGAPQLSKAQGPVRLAVSGRSVGPPLWESLAVLGADRTLSRLRDLRSRLD